MENSENWFDKGVSLSEEGQYEDAISAFNKAITCNQSTADAWCNRGILYAQLGKYRLALQSLDQTLTIDPGHGNAQKARAMVLDLMEKRKNEVSTPSPFPAAAPPQPAETAPPVSRKTITAPATVQIRNPVFAVIFSFLFPGWGQWYNGRRWEGLAFFVASVISGILNLVLSILLKGNFFVYLVFNLLGLAIWIYGMYNAYTVAKQINAGETGFTRKSRLFWFPPVFIVLMILVTILLAAVIAAFVFGMAGNVAHTKVVAATVAQQGDTIVVTYQGGQDADTVTRIGITVTDSTGRTQAGTMGPPEDSLPLAPGSIRSFTGSSGRDHVVAAAEFLDGSEQVILDTYV